MTSSTTGVAVLRSRGVSTARTVLHLLRLLREAPGGLRADEVAQALGKSTSTAYSLLDTLCQERFVTHEPDGAYRLTDTAAALVPRPADNNVPGTLVESLDELFARTHKRVYLAAAHSGQVVIPLVRGRQGMPVIPGLGRRIGTNAHALGLGKIALSLLDEPHLERYISHGLRRFTPHTIVSGDRLRAELDEIRTGAVASDRQEFAEDFCCLAAPVWDGRGRAVAAFGMSMSTRAFELERAALTEHLMDVSQQASQALGSLSVPANSEDRTVLDGPRGPAYRQADAPFTPSPDRRGSTA